MSVTRDSRHIEMTAAADAVTGRIKVTSCRWVVTGGTVGQQLIIKNTNGDVLVNHLVAVATEDVEFVTAEPEWWNGIKLDTIPAAGGGKLQIRYI